MDKSIRLAELLPPDRVVVGLDAETYASAVETLLDRLDSAGIIHDRASIETMIQDEDAGGDIPTIGERALLAHYRTDAATELAVAVGTSEEPFPFAPALAPGAGILILIVTPRAAAKYYLKVVAALSSALQDEEVAEAIMSASSPEELLDAGSLRGIEIQPELVAGDLMSREVNAAAPETPLSEVLALMVRRSRRAIPVVGDAGDVLGLVTEVEILQHFLPQLIGSGPAGGEARKPITDVEVRDVMQRSVLCVSEDQLISDVIGIMRNKNLAQFPVVREGKLIGFLSRTDLIQKLLALSV